METIEQNNIEPTEEGTTEPEAFCIDTAEKADWLLRKLNNLRAERERIDAQAKKIKAQLENDEKALLHRFGEQLEAFARAQVEASKGRRKSVSLLQGTIGFRSVAAGIAVDNHDPEAINEATRRGFVAVDLKAYQKEAAAAWKQGELLPGCRPTEEAERFYFTFATKDSSVSLPEE